MKNVHWWKMKERSRIKPILHLALVFLLVISICTILFHFSGKNRYIHKLNSGEKVPDNNYVAALNTEKIGSLPLYALSVETAWYEGFISNRFLYRKSYIRMLDMIMAGVEGIPEFVMPTYISAEPMIHIKILEINGKFYAFADDRNVSAYLLDKDYCIVGYIELKHSGIGKVDPVSLVRGEGVLKEKIVKEHPDEELLFFWNGNATQVLNSKDEVFSSRIESGNIRIEAGCYNAIYSNELALSYNEIRNNAVPLY